MSAGASGRESFPTDRQIDSLTRSELEAIVASLRPQPTSSIYGMTSIAAAIVAKPGRVLNAADVRAFLMDRLPFHLVPERVRFLDEIPVNPNGKQDRSRLEASFAALDAGEDAQSYPAQTLAERWLAKAWESVLHRDGFGLQHNFFESGGASLDAMRLVARMSEILNARVQVRLIFSHPQLGEQAAAFAALAMDTVHFDKRLSESLLTVSDSQRYPQ